MEKRCYELTNPQMRIVYNDIMNPRLEMANVGYLVNAKKRLDPLKLEKAWNEVLKQNDGLRIQINNDKKLNQFFKDHKYTKIDLINYTETHDLMKHIKKKYREKFDIFEDTLTTLSCIHFNSEESGFYVKFHHSVIDGISAALVIEDILKFYDDNHESLVNSSSYTDFIEYEKSYLNSKRYETNKQYWLEKFKTLDINTTICEIQKEVKFFTTKKKYISVSKDLFTKINLFSKENNTTYFKLLSTAMAIYFERIKNENKILIGRAIHNRTKKNHRSIVGMFVSTVPLIIEINQEINVLENLKSINTEMMSNMRHEKFPYNSLISLLRQDENSNVNSDFINITISENPPINHESIEILEQFFPKHSGYEMSIVLNPRNKLSNNEMEIAIDYAEEVLSLDEVTSFIHRLNIIIENIIDSPTKLIKDIEIISEAEKRQITCNFNETSFEYSRSKSVVELFEIQAEKSPENTAVIYDDDHLTYKELNEKSNQLAHLLKIQGLKTGELVPILYKRSFEMIIGILAIHKAGGAYLPIDPKTPKDRINFILEDSSAQLVLTKLPQLCNPAIKCIAVNEIENSNLSTVNLNISNNLNNPCYTIYTSGSTGNPKGVQIAHNSFLNLVKWYCEYANINSSSAVLLAISSSFDASVKNIYSPLVSGGRLLLAHDDILDMNTLVRLVYRNEATILNCVPSLFYAMLEHDKRDNYQHLNSFKNVLTGGEKLDYHKIQDFLQYANKDFIMSNIYGPTECTDISTAYSFTSKDDVQKPLPIGTPIFNSKAVIVDKYGHLAPIDFPGELCILGEGLALGYLNRPDLTAEKFIKSSFFDNSLMYKTGDLAKWEKTGNIDYLGRIDFQVKIRGFRIELGEIESRLSELNGIELVTVIDRENDRGDKFLAAYYTGEEYEISRIRRKLSKVLPDYMIPQQYIFLDKMPFTISGKIDRKALPVIENNATITSENLTGSIIENEIIMIWKDVLERDDIDRNSDFFVLGGDSLDAIRVVGRLSKNFNISATDMFEQKTVMKLAEKIRGDKKSLEKNISVLKDLFYKHECEKQKNYVEELLEKEFHKYEKDMTDYIENRNTATERIHNNVLLTGATGYLGAHLLYDLIKRTNAHIYVIIRGNTLEEAKKRIIDKMKFYFEDEYKHEIGQNRVTVLAGDISKDNLGLDEKSLELIKDIDCIINSAANVKHYGRYKDFHAVNVKGVENLLELCKRNTNIDFFQISTKSVASGTIPKKDYLVYSETSLDEGQEINNFYIKTKLEAEKLCEDARGDGVNANILRVGNLVFNSKSGKFQENIEENAFYSKVKDMLATGKIPKAKNKSLEFSFELSYIDFVSKAIVLLISEGKMDNEVMHVYNPHNVSMYRLGKHLADSGENIELLEIDEYFDFLKEHHECSDLQVNVENILLNMMELSKSSTVALKSCRTNKVLERLKFEWEKPKAEDIAKMLKYGKDVGFF